MNQRTQYYLKGRNVIRRTSCKVIMRNIKLQDPTLLYRTQNKFILHNMNYRRQYQVIGYNVA